MDRLEFFNKCLDTQYESLGQVNWNDIRLYNQFMGIFAVNNQFLNGKLEQR